MGHAVVIPVYFGVMNKWTSECRDREVRKINFFKVGLRTRKFVEKVTLCGFKIEKLKLFETWKFKMRFKMRHAVGERVKIDAWWVDAQTNRLYTTTQEFEKALNFGNAVIWHDKNNQKRKIINAWRNRQRQITKIHNVRLEKENFDIDIDTHTHHTNTYNIIPEFQWRRMKNCTRQTEVTNRYITRGTKEPRSRDKISRNPREAHEKLHRTGVTKRYITRGHKRTSKSRQNIQSSKGDAGFVVRLSWPTTTSFNGSRTPAGSGFVCSFSMRTFWPMSKLNPLSISKF